MDVAPEERGEQQPASFEVPASLPRRVRGGSGGPHPPARVARPVLPESFLERVRTAAQAEAAKLEHEEPSSPDPPPNRPPASTESPAQAPSREAPSRDVPSTGALTTEAPVAEAPSPMPSDALPRRVRGAGVGPRPPARAARPVLPESLLERLRAHAEAEAENEAQESAAVPWPRRDPEHGDGPQPADLAAPAAWSAPSIPRDAVTEPIPVISVAAAPAAAEPVVDEVAAPPPRTEPAQAPAEPEAAVTRTKPRSAHSTLAPTTPRPPGAAGTGTPKRQPRASRSYRMAGLLVVTVVIGGLALGFTLFHHAGGKAGQSSADQSRAGQTGTGGSGASHSGGRSPGTPASPADLRNVTAAWVTSQVSSTAMVSCDPVMCQALKSHGRPAAQLLVIKPGKANPLGSAVIVATPVLQIQIGSRLGSVYAPAVLARFGSGSRQIQVRIIAPRGAAAYMAQAQADLAARKLSGTELAQSSRIVVSGPARRELASGEVDSRLMTVMTGLAARHPLDIMAFGDAGPSADVAPFRSAELAGSNLKGMLSDVRGQQSPYRVTHATFARLGTGQTVLSIDFPAPTTFGLLGQSP